MSSPANRTALRGGGEPVFPGQPAGHRQRGEGPDPVQPGGQHLGAGQVPGRVGQLVPQLVQPAFQNVGHLQGGGDLQLPGRGQMRGRDRPQRGHVPLSPQRALAQGRGTLMEQHRMDALHPGGVLAPQVVIGLQQGAAFQDVAGRDPAFRQPAVGQQHPQVPAVGLVGLGVPLAAAGERGVGRLGQMRRDPRRGQFLGDIPPSGAPSTANAASSRPLNRASQARRCARSAGLIWPRRTCPVPVSR
jgi:hypothetical protein